MPKARLDTHQLHYEIHGDAPGVPLVLVRPDQHVAWRSRTDPTAEEAHTVLTIVTGQQVPA